MQKADNYASVKEETQQFITKTKGGEDTAIDGSQGNFADEIFS